MKIFTGGFHHESDTFNPIVTTIKDILVRRGEQLQECMREDSLYGINKALRDKGFEVVSSLHARAVPNGEWDKNVYLNLREEFLTSLKEALPVDGICLALHGSMRVKEIGKAESDLLKQIRLLCSHTPITASLDMHATITEELLALIDGVVGYKCAPHTDTIETGIAAANLLIKLINNKRLYMSAFRIPMLIAGEKSETSTEPMKSIMAMVREREKEAESVSLFMGFPWADVEENGVTALCVSAISKSHAASIALDIANTFCKYKDAFSFCCEAYEELEALAKCKEYISQKAFPIIISDSGDNPTAGSSGDVTNFLRKILDDNYLTTLTPPLIYQAFYDPEVVELAFKSGVGSYISGKLGAKFDNIKSKSIEFEGKVIALCPSYNKNRIALIRINGVDVVVTSAHVGCYEVEMMVSLGVVAKDRRVIVVKLGYLEPELKAIANKAILALTDGSSNELFERLEYKNLPRPFYPLDIDAPIKIKEIL